jgi:gluconolactonase
MIRQSITMALCAAAVVAGAARAEDAQKTKAVKLSDKVTLQAPADWKQEEPTSSFRKAQFSIPAAQGDESPAEMVVFSFGGSAGGVDANVKRWIDQFDPKGREAEVVTGEAKTGKYVLADLSGTYNMPVGPPIQRQTKAVPGSRVLAVILAVDGEEVYFLKMSGPDKTVAAQVDALRASFGADKSKEKKYEMPAE